MRVLVCLNNTYSFEGVCVETCLNSTAPFYYIDHTTLSCVVSCPDYYYKDNIKG